MLTYALTTALHSPLFISCSLLLTAVIIAIAIYEERILNLYKWKS